MADWIDLGGLGGQFWSTLIGALVGAAITGLFSFVTLRLTARQSRIEHLAAQRESDLATAFSLIAKLIRIYSNISHLKAAFEQGLLNMGLPDYKDAEPWHVFPPLPVRLPEINLTNKELGFILRTKIKSLLIEAPELFDIYNDLIQLVALYSQKRTDLTSNLPSGPVIGSTAETAMTPEEVMALVPKTVPLNMLIDTIIQRCAMDFEQAENTFIQTQTYCLNRFGSDFPSYELAKPRL